MKKKYIYGVIVAVLVLILTLGVLAACNDKDGDKPTKYTVNFIDGETNIKSLEFDSVYSLKDSDIPAAPEYEGKQFVGWFLEDGVTEVKEAFVVDKKEINVYAKYNVLTFTVEFIDDSSGSDVTIKNMTVSYGHELSEAEIPVAPTYDKMTFMGWLLENGVTEVGVGYKVTADVKAYAYYVDGYVVDGFRYIEKEDDTYVVSAFGGNYAYPAAVTIKAEVNGKAVTEIGDMSKLSANAITVPASVTKIADGAFKGNNYVYDVDLSAFGGSIGAEAFMGGKLRYIDLGGTKVIGANAFKDSTLALLFVPSGVENIGDGAFDSASLIEVGFENAFPAVDGGVFGSGDRGDDNVSIVASVTAWEALAECDVDDASFINNVMTKLNVEDASIFTWSDEMIAEAVAYHGRYVGDNVKVYLSMGINAVLDKGDVATVTSVYDGAEPSDHIYEFLSEQDTADRNTYFLDKVAKTVQLIEANAAGEVIKGEYLYDYKGNALRYTVSSAVTKIAGGAGQLNPNVRFLEIGDNVTSVGSFAFSSGNLFGITIGSNVKEILEFAFFGQGSLQQLLFTAEEDAPEIGQGAFTVLVSGAFAPVTYNQIAQYGMAVKIYLVNALTEGSFWDPTPGKGIVFQEALNQALVGLPVVKVGNVGDAEEDFKDAKYEDGSFTTFKTDGFAGKGKQYTAGIGTITMSGTSNGYAYIDFASGGKGYIYFSHVPGYNLSYYDSQSVPLKIQVFTEMIGGAMQSEVIYGYFKDTELVLRGAEAGIFGDIDNEYVIIDGYSKIEYHKQDGSIVSGTYTAAGNVLTVTGIDGVSEIDFNATEHALYFNAKTLSALGEEAGVYYDLFHAAMVKLDGKSFEGTTFDATVTYSGMLYYTKDGVTSSAPYIIDGKNIIFTLNGESKKWTFDKQSQKVEGDYDADYNTYTFVSMSVGTHGVFDNGDSHLDLDGFYTAKLDGKSYSYYQFGSSVVVFMPEGDKVYNLDIAGHAYSAPTAAEAGVYYASSGDNDKVIFNGLGQLLYINGAEFKAGDYALTQNSITVHINGSTDAKHTGYLDAQNGIGYIVYDYSGDTFLAVSKTKFDFRNKTAYIPVYKETNGEYSFSAEGFTVHVSNGYIIYGNGSSWYNVALGFTVKKLEGDTAKPITFTVDIMVNDDELKVTMTVNISGVSVMASVGDVGYLCAASGNTYYINWLDEDHTVAGIYYYSSDYPYNAVVGKVSKTDDQTFTVSGGSKIYTVSGYGTDNVTITQNTQNQ